MGDDVCLDSRKGLQGHKRTRGGICRGFTLYIFPGSGVPLRENVQESLSLRTFCCSSDKENLSAAGGSQMSLYLIGPSGVAGAPLPVSVS